MKSHQAYKGRGRVGELLEEAAAQKRERQIFFRQTSNGSLSSLDSTGGCNRLATSPENGRTKPVSKEKHVQLALRRLDFGLLRDLQRVIDLDSEVSNGAFQLAMTKQELNGP